MAGQHLTKVSLLILERGAKEAAETLLSRPPGLLPARPIFPTSTCWKTSRIQEKKRNWNYDKEAYYGGTRAVKRWKSTATKPKKANPLK